VPPPPNLLRSASSMSDGTGGSSSRSHAEDLRTLLADEGGWDDITASLREDAKRLPRGAMVHGPRFSLYEAMSALEIMDAKMDPGMDPGDAHKDHPALKGADTEAKIDLSKPEILAVMDRLVACLVAWCNGAMFCHTFLTCKYVQEDGKYLSNPQFPPVLKTFITGMLKLCKEIRGVILKADIFEEEDFVPSTFDKSLCESKPDRMAILEIETMMAQLDLKQQGAQGGKDEGPGAQDLDKALSSRLELVRGLWLMHQSLAERKHEEAKALIAKVEQSLKNVRVTQKFSSGATTYGFDVNLARTIVPHHPPRIVNLPNQIQTTLFFLNLTKHLKRLLCIGVKVQNLEHIIEYLQGLSVDSPGILARSHCLLMLHTEEKFMGRASLAAFCRTSFMRFSPTFALADKDPDMKLLMDRVAKPICLVLRLFCDNRARQRRKIGKLLLDWGILQQDSMVLDKRVQNKMDKEGIPMSIPAIGLPSKLPCFGWVFDQTLNLLQQHILLSFELELFSPREFAPAYWYWERLLSLKLQNIEVARRPIDPRWQKKFDSLLGVGASTGKKKKRDRKKKAAASKSKITAELMMTQGKRDLCRGIYKSILAFQKLGVIKFPELPYGNDALTFEHRYAEFRKVPQPIAYEYFDFLRMNDQKGERPLQLFHHAYASLENAKNIIVEASKRVNLLPANLLKCNEFLKVVKRNSATLFAAQKAMKAPPPGKKGPSTNPSLEGYKIDFEFKLDRLFVVLKLTEVPRKAAVE